MTSLNLGAYYSAKITHYKRGEDAKEMFSIDKGYDYLWKPNKDFVNTGSSTYGEITRPCIEVLIQKIRKEFRIFLNDEEKHFLRVLDVGGGLMTTIFHVAQKIEGFYCGIEYCAVRSKLFTQSYKKMLEEHQENIKNTNIAYFLENVVNSKSFNFDLVYAC